MPLSLINIRPGFNKQITDTAAEGQYVDGDFVRFRSGLPEKIGGWEKITTDTLVGVARAQHQYTTKVVSMILPHWRQHKLEQPLIRQMALL